VEGPRSAVDTGDRRGRLRWRCRRGMRELDALLVAFLETEFDDLPAREKVAFAEILELPDPEILGLLLGRVHAADPHVAHVIAALRHRTRADP
jgi:antitoxin CptB